MPTFAFTATRSDGRTKSGTMSGEDRDAVVGTLSQMGWEVVSAEPADGAAPKAESEPAREKSDPSTLAKTRVKSELLMTFTRQLATMVGAGLPIDQAVETLAEQCDAERFQEVLYDILERIRQGERISGAFSHYGRIFPNIYISMVRAAEASGKLDTILNQLANYMESSERVKQKVKSAMTYPVIATILIAVVASVLMFVVVPKFANIFTMIKGDLPLPTKIVLAISNFARAHSLLVGLSVPTAIALFVVVSRTKRGTFCLDMLKLNVPIFGKLFCQVAIARFSRTLSTLLSSGVPILDALSIVEQASGNAVIALAVHESIGSVSSGSSLASVFEQHKAFPPMLVKMIAVGEQTGQLDTLLKRIADFYDERVTAAVEGLTSMIEPLLIAFLGLIVGGIVMAIFLPMIKITQSIGGG